MQYFPHFLAANQDRMVRPCIFEICLYDDPGSPKKKKIWRWKLIWELEEIQLTNLNPWKKEQISNLNFERKKGEFCNSYYVGYGGIESNLAYPFFFQNGVGGGKTRILCSNECICWKACIFKSSKDGELDLSCWMMIIWSELIIPTMVKPQWDGIWFLKPYEKMS